MRLPNGYGSIVKLTGKRRKPYCVRTACKYTIGDGKLSEKRDILGYYATKSEALAALAEYNADPYDLSKHNLTFADVYEKWSEIKFPQVSIQSQYGYKSSYKKCASLYDMPFADIRLVHMQSIMDTLNSASKSTANNLKLLFVALSDYAIKHEVIQKDYSKYVELRYKNAEESIHKAFTEDEINELWSKSDDDMAASVLILIYTGWRISELINIDEVNLDEMYMRGGLKTEAGKNRIVPIHHRIIPLVKRLYKDGKIIQICYERYKTHFMRLCPDHRVHDTRHTFVSRLQSTGADHICIERLTGHASRGVTDKIYTHKNIDELRQAIELLK